MTSELLRAATEALRNIERRQAWAERWKARFGTYPPSYGVTKTKRISFRNPLWARISIRPPVRPHVGHGNANILKFPRHSRQSRYSRQTPPEAA